MKIKERKANSKKTDSEPSTALPRRESVEGGKLTDAELFKSLDDTERLTSYCMPQKSPVKDSQFDRRAVFSLRKPEQAEDPTHLPLIQSGNRQEVVAKRNSGSALTKQAFAHQSSFHSVQENINREVVSKVVYSHQQR